MNRSLSNARAKAFGFVFVVALHVGVFVIVANIKSTRTDEPGVTTQFFFVAPSRTPEALRDRNRKQKQIGETSMAPDAEEVPPIDVEMNLQVAPIDWDEQGKRAVRALTGQGLQDQSTNAKTGPREPHHKSVFERPLHQNGDSLQIGNGEVITWIDNRNGRCYVTNLPSEVARIDERNIVTICKPQGQPVDTHLLDELRPNYLRERVPNQPR